jgi:anti-anti-sigma regulatory factor
MQSATPPSSLRRRQLNAFGAILDWLFKIVAGTVVVLSVAALVTRFQGLVVGLALSAVVFGTCVAASRRQLAAGKVASSLLLLFVPMFVIGMAMAVFFRAGSYLLGMATIMAMLIVGMVLSVRAALWLTLGGLALFLTFAVLAQLGVFDHLYGPPGTITDYLSPLITLTALMFIGVLAFILNQSLLDSLHEAEERGRHALEAQVAQAATLAQIQQQAAEQAQLLSLVRELETPVIPVLDGVLVLPLVGHLDPQRIAHLSATLLEKIHQQRAHMLLLDLTGVSTFDHATATDLLGLVAGVRLLGADVMLTGIRAEVAQMLASLNLPLGGLRTAASLQSGIRQVSAELGAGAVPMWFQAALYC